MIIWKNPDTSLKNTHDIMVNVNCVNWGRHWYDVPKVLGNIKTAHIQTDKDDYLTQEFVYDSLTDFRYPSEVVGGLLGTGLLGTCLFLHIFLKVLRHNINRILSNQLNNK